MRFSTFAVPAALLVLLVAACSDSPKPPDTSCGPMTCGGCCRAGLCEPGESASACGTGGNACQTCRSGDTCDEGVCVGPDGIPTGTHILFEPLLEQPLHPDVNDVHIDPATGRLNLPLPPDASPAQRELTLKYLNTLNGFLTTSVPSATASAQLDPTSVREASVRVIQLAGPASQAQHSFGYNPANLRISIFPPRPDGWSRGARYAVVLVGGASGLRDSQGKPVVAGLSWYRVRSTSPLVDASGRSTVSGLADAEAQALEALRRRYAPVLDQVAGQGIARENVAALWTFTITDQPEAAFNLFGLAPTVPYPNDLYMDPATGLVRLPVP